MLYSGEIVEYDIEHANIAVLYDKGLITTDSFMLLRDANKRLRNEMVGKLILDDAKIYDEIQSGVREAMKKFFKLNKITKARVIEVVNDAVWLRDTSIKHTRISDNILFVRKTVCSLMIKLDKQSIYKTPDKIIVRGGRISKEHPSYQYMMSYLTALENRETKLLHRSYMRLRRSLNAEDVKLISSIENSELIKQLKSYAV